MFSKNETIQCIVLDIQFGLELPKMLSPTEISLNHPRRPLPSPEDEPKQETQALYICMCILMVEYLENSKNV
jgi:hypothetical protein